MNIFQKLSSVQVALKAPKNQYNSFGKYHYRNLEDIVEAVKPLLLENGLTITISDTPIAIGDRIYIMATATLTNVEKPDETITANAYARESEKKKGMDDAQLSGATSSYARKYCLNGLLMIDDCKDIDSHISGQKTSRQRLHDAMKNPDIVRQAYKQCGFENMEDKNGLKVPKSDSDIEKALHACIEIYKNTTK